MVVLDKISPNQSAPVVLENYGHLPSAKLYSRCSMLSGLLPITKTPNLYTVVYHHKPWLVSTGCASPISRLNCKHEEADDRLIYHVRDILSHWSGPTSITLSSGDTDVFVCMLYHSFWTQMANIDYLGC